MHAPMKRALILFVRRWSALVRTNTFASVGDGKGEGGVCTLIRMRGWIETGFIKLLHRQSTNGERHQQPTDHQVGKMPPRRDGLPGAKRHHEFSPHFFQLVHVSSRWRSVLALIPLTCAEPPSRAPAGTSSPG